MKSYKDSGRSLSFSLFKAQLTMDLSSYWLQIGNNEYAKRWINEKLTDKQVNTTYQDDNKYPFSYISLTKEEYLERTTDFEGYISENIIMAIFSTLETYCYVSLQRAIFLDSSIALNIKGPEKTLSLEKFIEIMNAGNSKYEMSITLAELLLRGKSTYEMVEYIAGKYKSGVFSELLDFSNTLKKYIYIRNSIVHNNRRVSKDLSNNFPEFKENTPFSLNYKNVMELNNSVLEIIKAIDKRYKKEIIKDEDAKWLIREIYIQRGIEDIREIKQIVLNMLATVVNENMILKAISEVKKQKELNKDFVVFSSLLL